VREEIQKLYAEYEDQVDAFFIVSHMEIEEAELGANDMKLKTGFSIYDEIFKHPKLVYAALGHIHKPQRFDLVVNGAKIVYSGSPISKDFNEAKDWRRVYMGQYNPFSKNLLYLEEVPINDRDFITIENNEGIEHYIAPVINGSIVKLRYRGTKDEIRNFHPHQTASMLEKMGAFQVKIDIAVSQEIKENTEEVFSEDVSIPKACENYINLYAPEGLDKNKL
jgi:DNA repair exonuclease SbcCD nuclease subunit